MANILSKPSLCKDKYLCNVEEYATWEAAVETAYRMTNIDIFVVL